MQEALESAVLMLSPMVPHITHRLLHVAAALANVQKYMEGKPPAGSSWCRVS